MPVPEQVPISRSTGNGVTTVFPYPFKIAVDTDLEVSVNGQVKTLGVDYSLSGVGVDGGGNVTFTTAPATGLTVTRRRAMPLERSAAFQTNGDLTGAALNADQDSPVLMLQQIGVTAEQSLRLPYDEEPLAALPAAADRADRFLTFDVTTGAPEVSSFTVASVERALTGTFGGGSRIPSTEDFTGTDTAKFTSLNGTVNGGPALIPNVSYSIGSFEFTAAGKYMNDSNTMLSTYFYNPGEVAGTNTTRNLSIYKQGSTPAPGKKRFGSFDRGQFAGIGSTVGTSGAGDWVRGINSSKNNYATTGINGEIGGTYTVIRQGGGAESDCSAELYDVATYSDSIALLTEGVTTKINAVGVITDRIRVLTGFLTKGIGDMGGIAIVAEAGVASALMYVAVNNGVTATRLLQFVDQTAGLGSSSIFTIDGTGNQTTFMRNPLGAVLNNNVVTRSINVYDTNRDEIREQLVRTGAGATYTSAEWRMDRIIDNATIGAGMHLGYDVTLGHKVSLTSGALELLVIGANRYIGFNGSTPITRPVINAASADLATAIALVNQIRAGLIAYGLFV